MQVLKKIWFICEDEIHYRLSGVDAPEASRAGDYKATRALKELIIGKELEIIREQQKLSYERPVVVVRVIGDNRTVNEKMNNIMSGIY